MSRLEIQGPIDNVEDLQVLCNRAKDGFESVCVPPFFVDTAGEMLGRNKVTICTTAGQPDDRLDTKLMGIESAARAGAKEVIVGIPQANIQDDKWDVIEKELYQLYLLCNTNNLILWVTCDFESWGRNVQTRICEAMPKKLVGLRITDASIDDVNLARICRVQLVCVVPGKDFEGVTDADPTHEQMAEMEAAGATQFVLKKKPPQLKTSQVTRTEARI